MALFLCSPKPSLAGEESVSIKNDEIWYKAANSAKPKALTSDKLPKNSALLSPDGTRIVYQITGNQDNKLESKIVLLSVEGKQLWQTRAKDTNGQIYQAPSDPEWIDNNRLGVDCHVNPSTSQYIVMSAKDGRAIADYLGINFCWSPDRKLLAHVGILVHFSYPKDQSWTLEFNNTHIYPPEKGQFSQDNFVHEFKTEFAWSADSKSIAFVDNMSQRFLVFIETAKSGEPIKSVALKEMGRGDVHPENVIWCGARTAKITYSQSYADTPQMVNIPSSSSSIFSEKNFVIDAAKKVFAQASDAYIHEIETKPAWSQDGKSIVFVDKVSQPYLVVTGAGTNNMPLKVIPLHGKAVHLLPDHVEWVGKDKIRISYSNTKEFDVISIMQRQVKY